MGKSKIEVIAVERARRENERQAQRELYERRKKETAAIPVVYRATNKETREKFDLPLLQLTVVVEGEEVMIALDESAIVEGLRKGRLLRRKPGRVRTMDWGDVWVTSILENES